LLLYIVIGSVAFLKDLHFWTSKTFLSCFSYEILNSNQKRWADNQSVLCSGILTKVPCPPHAGFPFWFVYFLRIKELSSENAALRESAVSLVWGFLSKWTLVSF
jgi:hypothetical protein